ncbi:MAG TPA: tetratricopeptide repeat protein [Pyrinomonadaceae bacterium]|nr:tetratricopeptide repeat protein [Pyrinomonadaceae bacterium]
MINSIKNPLMQIHRGHAIYLTILVLSLAAQTLGQAPGSTRGLSSGDGTHTIQGRVFFPNGQTLNGASVKVNLESINSTGGGSTTTDQDGSFRFNNIRAGNYAVVVEGGKEYEAAREPVSIDPNGTSGPITSITIHLRPRVDASNPAFAGIPQNALDFYQKGTAAAQKNNPQSATEFLSKAVAAYPNFPLALHELGAQYQKLKQWDKAAETFEALLKLKPADPLGQLNLGIALYNQGVAFLAQKNFDDAQKKLDASEAHLREAIKLNSPGPAAHYYLGMLLINFKAFAEAQTEFELAISNGGENLALAHKFLGGAYMSTHKNKEAADELEKYLKLDPKAPDADKIKETIKTIRGKQ